MSENSHPENWSELIRKSRTKRKIVQIAFCSHGHTGEDGYIESCMYALADDGTVWRRDYVEGPGYVWKQSYLEELPDTDLEEKQNEPKN